MARQGLTTFLGNGIRFKNADASANYVGMKITSNPASSFNINWLTSLPGSQQALTIDASGNIATVALGGSGTVTSVDLTAPSVFSVTGNPVTSSGTLALTFATGQTQNRVLASPDGSSGAVSLRALVAADIPNLDTGKLTSGTLPIGRGGTGSTDGSITGSGAITFTAGSTNTNVVLAPNGTGTVDVSSKRITSVATPTGANDAANKAYVDAVQTGLDVKQSVRATSTATVSVTYGSTSGTSGRGQITAAPNTLDGVSLALNDRILLKDQSTAAQNGIWVVTTLGTGANGVWDRATDFDQDAEVTAGAFTFVEEGTANADSGWVLTTNNPIVIGGASGTSLAWAQFSGAGQINAGAGLTKTGNTIDVVGTTNRITVAADSIDISSSYVGQASITTLGTITTGTWTGTSIAVANGGTGATDAATARTNLSAAGLVKGTFTNASLTAGVLTITHNLSNQAPIVFIYDNNNKWLLPDDLTGTSTSACDVDLSSYGTLTGTWRFSCSG